MCHLSYRDGRSGDGKGHASSHPGSGLVLDIVTRGISFSPIILSFIPSYSLGGFAPKSIGET